MNEPRSGSSAHQALLYTVYLIKTCTPNFYYVGWARDVLARWVKHIDSHGAKFTKKHGVESISVLCMTNSWKEAEWREKLYVMLLQRENPFWVVSMGMPLSTKQRNRTLRHFGYIV